jgi:class 3 adenylate cyclase/tetratricopeptide (TPR) repeat protein
VEGAERAIERKVITALFCDIVGSTELGERLDPEDIDRLMSRYHALARRRIESNGGTVEKFIGDAVVGVFGAPLVHEDDPNRALRAGLAIIRELAESGLDLQVRIGVQTGEAVVRVGAERTAEEGLATGDILNTAARLQGAAPPGGIAVGEATHALTSEDFEWADLGEVALKGKAQPVHVWQPLRVVVSAPASQVESTKFIGRGGEIAALLGSFERAASRPGIELVTIIAEPGMGKSRLVRELGRRVLDGDRVTWRKGRSLPYGDGVSLWALGEIVKAHAGIRETDGQDELRVKLEGAIDEPDPDLRSWLRDRLAPLVGLRTDAATPPREEAFAAWARFLTSFAARGPAVLVFEDIHWADEALVDFLDYLAHLTDEMPLLLVVTARPTIAERHPAWLEMAARSTLMKLISLDDDAIRALVRDALPEASEGFIGAVLERAAGSPLYAEQLAALARERGRAGESLDEGAVPPTIRALLGARIDGLPPGLKPALLDASVVGRVFWSGAVATLERADRDEVTAILEDLAKRELARHHEPSSMADEEEYGFWHALLRDVAYSFLPRAARLTKHRAAASWITSRAGGGSGDLAEIVADHLRRAADLAAATDATEELGAIRSELATALIAAASHTMAMEPARAARQATEALELLDERDPRRPEALTLLGRARISRAEFGDAVAALDAAAAWHAAYNDPLSIARLAFVRSRAKSNAGDNAGARELLAQARPILEANPGPELVELVANEAHDAAVQGNLEGATAAAEAAQSLAAGLGLPRPHRALAALGLARLEARDARGEADIRDAIELALAAGDTRAALIALGTQAGILLELIDAEQALEAHDATIAFAGRYGLSDAHIRGSRLDALELAGRWDELLAEGAAMREAALERGDAWTELMARMQMGGVEVQRGDVTVPIDNVRTEAKDVGLQPGIGANVVALGALLRGDGDTVRRVIAETVAVIPPNGWIFGALDLVRAALAVGELGLARAVLEKAIPEDGPNSRNALTKIATALVHEAEGDVIGAQLRFAQTNDTFEKLGWPGTQVIALAGLGRTRVSLGDATAGLENLQAARVIATRLGMQPLLVELDAAIGDLSRSGSGSGTDLRPAARASHSQGDVT